MSFSVRSTHKFVNPQVVQEEAASQKQTFFDEKYPLSNAANVISMRASKRVHNNTDTHVKTGSSTGLAVRTVTSAMEDYY